MFYFCNYFPFATFDGTEIKRTFRLDLNTKHEPRVSTGFCTVSNGSTDCTLGNQAEKQSRVPNSELLGSTNLPLTFWRRIFFQILAHPVFKM